MIPIASVIIYVSFVKVLPSQIVKINYDNKFKRKTYLSFVD